MSQLSQNFKLASSKVLLMLHHMLLKSADILITRFLKLGSRLKI